MPSPWWAETKVASKASWTPPNTDKPSATTSNRLESVLLRAMSRSLTMTFVETRAPASRHICSTALSTAKPLLPRTPALLHAARWCPNTSRRRPHTQERTDKGKGNLRRRSRRVRKSSEPIRVTRHTGNAVRGADANGPLCDLTEALSDTDNCGHTAPPAESSTHTAPTARHGSWQNPE